MPASRCICCVRQPLGAAYNVRINLSGIKDRQLAGALVGRAEELLAQVGRASTELERVVEQRLGQ